jgi:hypothetical protein
MIFSFSGTTGPPRGFAPVPPVEQNHGGNHNSRAYKLIWLKGQPEVVEQP